MGMTTDEAIEIIESLYVTMSMWLGSSEEARQRNEAIKMAVDALKKQIPMKPTGEHYAHMRCPSCNHRIPSGQGSSSRRRDNWCNYCGQAINWSKET